MLINHIIHVIRKLPYEGFCFSLRARLNQIYLMVLNVCRESRNCRNLLYIYFFFFVHHPLYIFFLKFSVKVHHFLHSLINIILCSLCGEYILCIGRLGTRFTIIDYSNTSSPFGRGLLCLQPLFVCMCDLHFPW